MPLLDQSHVVLTLVAKGREHPAGSIDPGQVAGVGVMSCRPKSAVSVIGNQFSASAGLEPQREQEREREEERAEEERE